MSVLPTAEHRSGSALGDGVAASRRRHSSVRRASEILQRHLPSLVADDAQSAEWRRALHAQEGEEEDAAGLAALGGQGGTVAQVDDAPDSALIAACKDPAITLESLRAVVASGGAATDADAFGLTPLHWVCVNPGATVELVRAVHELEPGAIAAEVAKERRRDGDALLRWVRPGELPLHLVVRNARLSEGLLRAVLELDPSAATKTNNPGFTPLIMFCGWNPAITPETLRLVLELDPSAATKTSKTGGTPLHVFCGFNPAITPETLRLVLELDPSAATKTNNPGFTPLIMFCQFNPAITPETLRLVLELDPSAATKTDKLGNTPLHYICGYNPVITPETLRLVLELDPSAATKTTKLGSTPLHQFCMVNPATTPETLRLVHGLDPSAVTKTDVFGSPPLAYLALDAGPTHVDPAGNPRHRDPAALALALSEMGPATALAKAGTHAALHYACQRQSPERTNEIVGAMLLKHRGAEEGGDGPLPPQLLRLPARTLERVAACPRVTSRVNDVMLAPPTVDALVAEGSTRLLPLLGVYARLTYALYRAPSLGRGLGGEGGGATSLTPRGRFVALACVGVWICAAMAVREVRVVSAMGGSGLLGTWARDVHGWVALATPLVVGGVLAAGALEVHAASDDALSGGATSAATMTTPLVVGGVLAAGALEVHAASDDALSGGATSATMTRVAAVGMVLLTVRLLSWLRHWSMRFAMFVTCLGMIVLDLGPFLVVVCVVLVGCAWSLFLLGAVGTGSGLDAGGNALWANASEEANLTNATGDVNASAAGAESLLAAFRASAFGAYASGLLGAFGDERGFEVGALLAHGDPLVVALGFAFTLGVVLVMLNVLIAVVSDSYEAAMVRALRVYHRARLQVAVKAELVTPLWRPPDLEYKLLGLVPQRVPLLSFALFNVPLYAALYVLDGGEFCLHFALAFQYIRALLALHCLVLKGEGIGALLSFNKLHYLRRQLRFEEALHGESAAAEEESDDSWLGRVLDLERRVRRAVKPVGGQVEALKAEVSGAGARETERWCKSEAEMRAMQKAVERVEALQRSAEERMEAMQRSMEEQVGAMRDEVGAMRDEIVALLKSQK